MKQRNEIPVFSFIKFVIMIIETKANGTFKKICVSQ